MITTGKILFHLLQHFHWFFFFFFIFLDIFIFYLEKTQVSYTCNQWRSQKFLIGEADFEIVLLSDCCIRVTALLEYLDLLDQFSET